jgi:hypothetical protein
MQRLVMETLQPFRSENNYVAGGAALNQQWPRLSDDMDIFQELREELETSVSPEIRALHDAGFGIELAVNTPDIIEAIVKGHGAETRVQWFADTESCLRFFAAVPDEELGFRLHQADNAVSKVFCASRRNEAARDAVDLVLIVRHYAPLGPLVWAAAGKAAAINLANSSTALEENPMQLIQSIRANSFGYADEEIRTVSMEEGHVMTRDDVRQSLTPAIDAAQEYCEDTAPSDFVGHLFVDSHECPVAADGDTLNQRLARGVPIQNFTPLPSIN